MQPGESAGRGKPHPAGGPSHSTVPKAGVPRESPAFSHVAGVIADAIGAELITIPGGHGVQHRAGFNDRVLALWAGAESAAL